MTFAELTQAALLGTERQGLARPGGNRPLDVLLAQLNYQEREKALLTAAALTGQRERIGQLPVRDSAAAIEPSPAESLPRLNALAGSLLMRLLEGEQTLLRPEFLSLAAEAKQVAASESLPHLLWLGAREAELRESILPLLGARGLWLAAQNPEWGWAEKAGESFDSIWQAGQKGARLLLLQQLRRTDSNRARELLASTWKEEAPEDRGRFLAVFETGLNEEDEPFLEAALDDKRKEVRRIAANLLGRLPASAFARRMMQRVRPLLKFTPGEAGSLLKLKKAKDPGIEVALPAECAKDMQRDGIEIKPPQGWGEKAWWLIQMLEQAPLTFWTNEWQTTPEEIVSASQKGDWKKELSEAWMRAAIRQKNSEWAEPLFSSAMQGKRYDRFEGLLAAMTPARREQCLSAALAAKDKKMRELEGALVFQCRHPWSPEFSRAILDWLRGITNERSMDWQLRNQLKDIAARLHPASLAESAQGWPVNSESWEFWAKGIDEFLSVAQFRADMRAAIENRST